MAARKPVKPAADVELHGDGPEPQAAQFPALGGDPDAEIEQRMFRRTYVLDIQVDDDETAMRMLGTEGIKQDAVNRGLRPTGDPEVVEREIVPSRRATSTTVTLAVPVAQASNLQAG